MTQIASYREIAEAYEAGRVRYGYWRKTPSQTTVIGVWLDLSMMPGLPFPNYYASAPLESAVLDGADGILLDSGGTDFQLHRARWFASAATALPLNAILCDYLMYYPFVGMDTTDEQAMTQVESLPRYATGEGVQMMVVITNPPSAPTNLTFQVGYTNQDGTSGRITPVQSFGTGTHTGAIGTTSRTGTVYQRGPFLSLQKGDTGVRRVDSFQMLSGTDVGLVSVVLVKPLADITLLEQTAPVEVDFARDFMCMPTILDGAYLGFLVCPSASLASTSLIGSLTTIWSE